MAVIVGTLRNREEKRPVAGIRQRCRTSGPWRASQTLCREGLPGMRRHIALVDPTRNDRVRINAPVREAQQDSGRRCRMSHRRGLWLCAAVTAASLGIGPAVAQKQGGTLRSYI